MATFELTEDGTVTGTADADTFIWRGGSGTIRSGGGVDLLIDVETLRFADGDVIL